MIENVDFKILCSYAKYFLFASGYQNRGSSHGALYARQNFLVRSINYVINQSSDKHITPKEIKWVTVAVRGAEGSTETQANKQCTVI